VFRDAPRHKRVDDGGAEGRRRDLPALFSQPRRRVVAQAERRDGACFDGVVGCFLGDG
jgi:hypothetical protein